MNILTIDLEEWFHVVFEGDPTDWKNKESRVVKNTEFVLDELLNNNIKATFFTVGWIARQYPDLVKKINNAGFEIGSHSDSHRVVYKFSKSGFNADVKRSVESLEALIGKKVTSFRAPYFSLTNSVDDYLDTLVENGIEIDSSICPVVTKYGGYKNFPSNEPCLIKSKNCTIKEFPLSS
ncbi:MAG TPA: polysaccharide deacetylase family protein, partial [Mucilaginibacter sp.]|nr:polysaccharide deacetylase family protein [Mucilaginibacter sp.]